MAAIDNYATTYTSSNTLLDIIATKHAQTITALCMQVLTKQYLPNLYWIPKMNKSLHKSRFIGRSKKLVHFAINY